MAGAHEVFDLMRASHGTTVRLSAYSGQEPWEVMVVDRLGLLTQLYQIASIAVVCGSFVESIGGHNILESAVAGAPTIVGPFMHSQTAASSPRGVFGGDSDDV